MEVRRLVAGDEDIAEDEPGVGGWVYGHELVHPDGERTIWVLTDDANTVGVATYRSAGGQRDPFDQVMFTWRLAEGRHS